MEYYYLQFKPQSTNSNTQGVVFRHDINAVETRVGINTLDPAGALDVAVGDIMLRTGGIALGATPNYGTPGQVLTTNGHGSGVTWATISGGGTPETVATLSGMNFSSTGVGELIKKVDASNAGGSGIVTSETSVGGVETHTTIFGTSTTQLGNITTKKDATNNYTITLEPNSGSTRNMVLTDDGISVELSLSATGSVSVGDFILASTPATSDPVKTFNRLKTTKEQILSTDAVSQGLADPNKNEPISCQALLDSTANAVIASTNASGLHLLPPSGSVLQTRFNSLNNYAQHITQWGDIRVGNSNTAFNNNNTLDQWLPLYNQPANGSLQQLFQSITLNDATRPVKIEACVNMLYDATTIGMRVVCNNGITTSVVNGTTTWRQSFGASDSDTAPYVTSIVHVPNGNATVTYTVEGYVRSNFPSANPYFFINTIIMPAGNVTQSTLLLTEL